MSTLPQPPHIHPPTEETVARVRERRSWLDVRKAIRPHEYLEPDIEEQFPVPDDGIDDSLTTLTFVGLNRSMDSTEVEQACERLGLRPIHPQALLDCYEAYTRLHPNSGPIFMAALARFQVIRSRDSEGTTDRGPMVLTLSDASDERNFSYYAYDTSWPVETIFPAVSAVK